MNANSMKTAIFVVGQKGGAGKTTFARAALDMLRANGKTVAAFDGDGRVGQLLQYHGSRDEKGKLVLNQNAEIGVVPFDIRNASERDTLLNALDMGAETLLFDLPGGSMNEIADVLGTGSASGVFEEYRREGYRVIVVIVITPLLASARSVNDAIKLYQDGPDYLAVKNLAFGDPEDFLLFEGYTDPATGETRGGAGRTALLQHSGDVRELPKMNAATYALLDMYHLTITEALSDPRLPRADRSRVYTFRNAFYEEFKSLFCADPITKAAAE